MSSPIIISALLFASLLYVLYLGSRFTYTFEQDHLHIRWRLPGGLPFGSRRIPYTRIELVRPFSWRLDATGFGELWGNLPSRRGRVLILSASFLRRGPYRKLWVTPSDFAEFTEDLARRGVRCARAV